MKLVNKETGIIEHHTSILAMNKDTDEYYNPLTMSKLSGSPDRFFLGGKRHALVHNLQKDRTEYV